MDKEIKGGLDDPEYFGNEQRQVEQIMREDSFEDTIPYDQVPYARGAGVWAGVVLITRIPSPTPDSICTVMSARTAEFNGLRAIIPFQVPYSMVRHLFDSADGADAYAYGEFFTRENNDPGHLEFYEKASQKEFFLTAGGNVRTLYPHSTKSQVN